MKRRWRACFVLIVSLVSAGSIEAQSAPVTLNEWFQSRIDAAKLKLNTVQELALVVANGKGIDKQATTPSVDRRSASLVDQSSVPDLVSAAINFIPSATFRGASPSSTGTGGSGASGSGSVTATLYALMASARGTGVTDPLYYRAHPGARQLSFTAGSANSTQALDNTTGAAATLGVKYLVLNRREIFSAHNLKLREGLQALGGLDAIQMARVFLQVQTLIYQSVCPGKTHPEMLSECDLAPSTFVRDTLSKLSDDVALKVDSLIASSLAPVDLAFQEQIEKAYDEISKAPQISFAYATDLRHDVGYSRHRGAFILDHGLSKNLSYTVNASSEFIDRKGVSPNSNGGRFAAEGQYQITRSKATSTRSSLVLSFSGEGDWLSKQKPQYTGQVKTQIPLGSGISLPVAYTYQNRAAQLNHSNSEAKLGLSIDFAKVIQGLKTAK